MYATRVTRLGIDDGGHPAAWKQLCDGVGAELDAIGSEARQGHRAVGGDALADGLDGYAVGQAWLHQA
jgi:hypothetical protein